MTPQQILDLKQKIRELDAKATSDPMYVETADCAFARTALPTLLAYCEELEGKVKVAEDQLEVAKMYASNRDLQGLVKFCDNALATIR